MFQQNSKARVILNGHLSDPFIIHRGCRQGDPISPNIFILCSEFLALAFKNEQNFESIKGIEKDITALGNMLTTRQSSWKLVMRTWIGALKFPIGFT